MPRPWSEASPADARSAVTTPNQAGSAAPLVRGLALTEGILKVAPEASRCTHCAAGRREVTSVCDELVKLG